MENQKRHIRKLLSILLVLCMALSIVPITAFAGVSDAIGGGTSTAYRHTYHTNVKVTANVTVQDKDRNTTAETIFKESGFIEGGIEDAVVKSQITYLKNEIKANYISTWNFEEQNETESFVLDHFESANILDGDILDIHEYLVYEIKYDLIVQEPNAADEVITTVDIGNVWKNLDSSQPVAFTAEVNPNSECANQMMLTDEYWQQVAIDGSRIAKSNPQKPIAGETYSYAVELTAKDGYYFHDGFKGSGVGCDVICDGSTTTAFAGTLSDDRKQLILWFNNIKVTATDGNSQDIDVIEIDNATITFKDGDKPVFTGEVPDNEDYAFRCEWWSLDSNTGLVSTEPEWGSEIYKNKITTFEAGKTYHYGVYVTAYYGNFSPDAKLKINGQYVNYMRVGDDDDMQSMWLETDLTMTPTTSSHTHSYGADWKSDADNHWHECSCGSIADKAAHDMETKNAKDATAIEKGYTGDKVCKVCGYTVAGKEIPATGTTTPTEPTNLNGDGNENTNSPQTGDNSNILLWFAALFVSGIGIFGTTEFFRKKKRME